MTIFVKFHLVGLTLRQGLAEVFFFAPCGMDSGLSVLLSWWIVILESERHHVHLIFWWDGFDTGIYKKCVSSLSLLLAESF